MNGKRQKLDIKNGFAHLARKWKPGDTVTLQLDMPVRRACAHPAVKADEGRFAVERGPLVYCAEGADNGAMVLDKTLAGKVSFLTQERHDLLGGIVTIRAVPQDPTQALTCIPYYAWCQRGPNEMLVWFPTQ